jgi:hypothetical protein
MRNTIYLICGLEMVFCLTLIVLLRFLPKPQWLLQLHPNFLFESLAVEAFGVAWFVKGGNVLKDKDDVVAALYEMAGSVQPLDDSTQAVHAPQKTVKISHVLLGLIPTLLLLASVPLLAAKVPWAIWGIAFLLALFAIWLKWLSTRQSHRLIVEVSLQAAQQEENA